MSNSETFIDEVSEEVRKDQLFGYLRKYGWIAVVAVFVIVGGTAYTEYNKAQRTAAAQDAGDAILAALETDDDAARAAALESIDAQGGGVAAITGLLAAADLTETGDIAGAAAALDAVSLETDVPDVYRDLAVLKSVMVQDGSLSADDRRVMLSGLAVVGAPFRLLAEEQLALINVELGETDAAIAQFVTISQDAETTPGLRERAFSMIVALGGDLEALIGGGTGDNLTE